MLIPGGGGCSSLERLPLVPALLALLATAGASVCASVCVRACVVCECTVCQVNVEGYNICSFIG